MRYLLSLWHTVNRRQMWLKDELFFLTFLSQLHSLDPLKKWHLLFKIIFAHTILIPANYYCNRNKKCTWIKLSLR